MYSPFEWLWLLDMRGYGFCDGKKCTEVQRKYSGTGEEEKERGCSGQEEAVGLSNAFSKERPPSWPMTVKWDQPHTLLCYWLGPCFCRSSGPELNST